MRNLLCILLVLGLAVGASAGSPSTVEITPHAALLHLLADHDVVVVEFNEEASIVRESITGSGPGEENIVWELAPPERFGTYLCLGLQKEEDYVLHRSFRLPDTQENRENILAWLQLPD